MRLLLIAALALLICAMGERLEAASAPPPPPPPPPELGKSAALVEAGTVAVAAPLADAGSIAGAAPAADDREHFPAWVEDGIRDYGPISVFVAFIITGVGVHLSEDLILIPAGFLAAGDPHHPHRLFWEFAFWAYLGIVLGDAGWFWICRTFGTRFLHGRWFKRLMHPRRILEIKYQMDLRGAWVLLAARFIPGTRTPVITMGGLLHMRWSRFLAVELTCVLLTVPLQMGIGWVAAKAASSAGVTRLSHQIAIGLGVTVACVLALWLVHAWLRHRLSRRRPPRAPAQWLRIYDAPAALPAA